MNLWIVGQMLGADGKYPMWSLIGVFSTEERAKSACTEETYFMGPAKMNVVLPSHVTDWPGAYYPKGAPA